MLVEIVRWGICFREIFAPTCFPDQKTECNGQDCTLGQSLERMECPGARFRPRRTL